MNYQQKSDKPIVPLIIVATLYAVFLNLVLLKHDYDFSVFVTAGDVFVDADAAPSNLSVLQNSGGYDGQFYYRLALTPFTTLRTDQGITIDIPAYRQQRIVYPLLGWLFSFGHPTLLPISLIAVNFISLCILAWLGAKYVHLLNLHAIWGIIFTLFPGFLLVIVRDTTEIVEIIFLFATILALRHHRQFLAGILLTFAILTKETALVVSFGLLFENLFMRQRRHSQNIWFPVVIPIITYFLWQVWLKAIWTTASVTGAVAGANIGFPLVGISQFVCNIFPATGNLQQTLPFQPPLCTGVDNFIVSDWRVQQVWLVELFFIALFMFVVMRVFLCSTVKPFVKISWLLFAALVFSLTRNVWVEDWAFLRVLSEVYLFGMLILLESKSILKKWLFGGIVLSWILLIIEIVMMR